MTSTSLAPAKLDQLVRLYGISPTRPSPADKEVPISDEAKANVLAALNVDLSSEGGPQDLSTKPERKAYGKRKIPACYIPPFLKKGRVWGLSLQLYELRSDRNWGIGDFEDLHAVIDLVASIGGDFIGLNPLHAPLLADPARCSPYEPSNRQYLNPLYIAVDQVPGYQPSIELEEGLKSLRETDLVDYVGVARIKLNELGELWERWQQAPPEDPTYHHADFNRFVTERGESLRLHALFEAIST